MISWTRCLSFDGFGQVIAYGVADDVFVAFVARVAAMVDGWVADEFDDLPPKH
jgi:hypothetical protein